MATDTDTPPKTTPQATTPATVAKTTPRATKPVTDTKVPAKTTPRATKPVSAPFDVEGALKQWTETARKATDDTLELYVKTVHQLADAEVEAAQAIKLPIVATIAETNAAVSRRIASAYVAAARDLLKA